MSAKRENATIIGVAVAACAVCCAGPILGVLAAIGLGTAAVFALFGTIAVVIGAAAADAPPTALPTPPRKPCRSSSPTCGGY